MGYPTATITGKVRKPDGAIATMGTIYMQLSSGGSVVKGTVDDDTDPIKYEVLGVVQVDIDSNGDVNFVITPNDLITPTGTYYEATFLVDGVKWVEDITVTGTDPKDFSDLPRTSPPVEATAIAATPVNGRSPAAATDLGKMIIDTSETPVGFYICLPKFGPGGGYSWRPITAGEL